MTADRLVFWTILLGSAFFFGMDVGHWRARDQIAVTCLQQPGETLLATHHQADGTVFCEYGRAFGLATKRRKAT